MLRVYVTSAFSKDGKGGNKAGVVLDGAGLSRQQKLAIAAQLGYSETAYILPCDNADFELQYFTPTDEVDLCGHATIASFTTLRLLGKLNKDNYTIKTKAGVLSIKIEPEGLIFMEQNRPEYGRILPKDLFKNCFSAEYFQLPIQIVSTGLKDIIFPLASKEQLDALKPDFEQMSLLSRELGVVGVHAFAVSEEMGTDAVCRNFAPLYGIDEESATGTANCALACYLYEHLEKKTEYVFEQGQGMGQPSLIVVKLNCGDNGIESVYVGGRGYLVDEMELDI